MGDAPELVWFTYPGSSVRHAARVGWPMTLCGKDRPKWGGRASAGSTCTKCLKRIEMDGRAQ